MGDHDERNAQLKVHRDNRYRSRGEAERLHLVKAGDLIVAEVENACATADVEALPPDRAHLAERVAVMAKPHRTEVRVSERARNQAGNERLKRRTVDHLRC